MAKQETNAFTVFDTIVQIRSNNGVNNFSNCSLLGFVKTNKQAIHALYVQHTNGHVRMHRKRVNSNYVA